MPSHIVIIVSMINDGDAKVTCFYIAEVKREVPGLSHVGM